MPSSTIKQANTAKLAGAVKAGKFPKSKAGPAVKSMAKMPMNKLKHFMKVKECLSMEGKRKLLHALKLYKETLAPQDHNMLDEEDPTQAERNVIAKTFDTQADFDSYVNQRRGIEFTPKELQSIQNYKDSKPTQQDRFFVKYESTDDFGNNSTTIIKKLKEGTQFCFTAFSKHEKEEEEGKPEGSEEEEGGEELKEQEQSQNAGEDMTVNDKIRITKTITFVDDNEGPNILSDFLLKLDL